MAWLPGSVLAQGEAVSPGNLGPIVQIPASQVATQQPAGLCARISIERYGYLIASCTRISNLGQDMCAATSLQRQGYVLDDCFRVSQGAECAITSLNLRGYISEDCFRVNTPAQDACAASSMRANGIVTPTCFESQ